ncbi:MAG: glycosyltransferase, partial [Planctomycetota bacterium]
LRVVAGSSSRATNRKVATLVALEPYARRDVIVLVDSDVRLDAETLGRLAGAVTSEVGLATALYRGAPAGSLSSRIEALAINADFVPSVLVAHLLGGGIRFALGAANAIRREALQAIGGFASLGEVLADDHLLGKRIASTGRRVTIAPVCVPIEQDSSARDTFARLLRWCRTYRACQPVGYAATVFSHHGIAASLAAASAAQLAGSSAFWLLAAGTVALRLVTAAVAHAAIAGREADLASLPLLPVRDLVATALFIRAWLGRTVTWRGRRFRVAPDGTLTDLSPEPHDTPAALVAASGGL